MQYQIDLLKTTRNNIKALVSTLTLTQLNTKPKGFNNTIAWQLGHVIITQQLLCYQFSNENVVIPTSLIDNYRKGSFSKAISQDELDELILLLAKTSLQFEKDYKQNIFKTYTSYETSYGITINNIEDALQMNNVHEGVHFGNMLALKKLIIK